MTNMVIVAAVLERLHDLVPETNHESQVIAKVKDNLVHVREQLKKIMQDADAKHDIIKDRAKSFEEIMILCCDYEDLIESHLQETASRRNCLLNMISKRSTRKQIKVIERLSKKLAEMISIQVPSKPSATPPEHELLKTVKADAVETEEINVQLEEEDMDALIKGTPHLDAVFICGMPGMGKTTLARKLFQNRKIAGQFQVCAWVYVSQQFESKRIFLEILAVTSNNWPFERRKAVDMREQHLAELVYDSLKGRTYLIVLDDVPDVDDWFSLRMAFPDDSNGSRLLITTTEVKEKVEGHLLSVRCLSPDESWELFRRRLHLDEREFNAKPQIEKIGRKISRLSKGLPFIVVLMAGVSSKIPLHAWKELAKKLDRYSYDRTTTELEYEKLVVEFSYKYLPPHLMPCLLYLGIFPEDRAIEWDTVCQLWIAEGLISKENIRKGETMMDVAARYLDELASRNLLITENQDSRQRRFKSFRIHDLIREFCETRGEENKFVEVIHLGKENQNMETQNMENQNLLRSIRRSIHLNKYKYTHSLHCGNADYLRSLLLFTSNQSEEGTIRPQEIPNLDNFIWLRVLYLYRVDFMDGKFPKGVEKLVYLRYLGFRECYLEELSYLVGKMSHLQILDLRVRNDCEMTITDIFNNFKRLKYLYFPLAYRTIDDKQLRLGELKELEVLDNFDTSLCNAEDLRGLTNLKEVTITTKGDVSEVQKILDALEKNKSVFRSISLNIRNFDCFSQGRFSGIEKVFKSSAIHVLEIEGYLERLPEFNGASSQLTEITLNGSELGKDPMQILQELPNLTILVLEVEAYNEENMKCSSNRFIKLRHLKLVKLYKLKSWEVEGGAMPSLHTVVIENCKNLQMLPDGLKYCIELKKLEIASMPDAFVEGIQKSDGTEGEDFYKIKHVPNVKIDGLNLILKSARKDHQSSSTP